MSPPTDNLDFSLETVARVLDIAPRRIRYWHQTGILIASRSLDDGMGGKLLFYSFPDLVGLRVILMLRDEHHIKIARLREVSKALRDGQAEGENWASLTFWVQGQNVFFDHPITDARVRGGIPPQVAFPIEMDKVIADTRLRVENALQRQPEDQGHIIRSPKILSNAWTVKGTRIPVTAIYRLHREGKSSRDIEARFQISSKDVRAAIEHAESRRKAS